MIGYIDADHVVPERGEFETRIRPYHGGRGNDRGGQNPELLAPALPGHCRHALVPQLAFRSRTSVRQRSHSPGNIPLQPHATERLPATTNGKPGTSGAGLWPAGPTRRDAWIRPYANAAEFEARCLARWPAARRR